MWNGGCAVTGWKPAKWARGTAGVVCLQSQTTATCSTSTRLQVLNTPQSSYHPLSGTHEERSGSFSAVTATLSYNKLCRQHHSTRAPVPIARLLSRKACSACHHHAVVPLCVLCTCGLHAVVHVQTVLPCAYKLLLTIPAPIHSEEHTGNCQEFNASVSLVSALLLFPCARPQISTER